MLTAKSLHHILGGDTKGCHRRQIQIDTDLSFTATANAHPTDAIHIFQLAFDPRQRNLVQLAERPVTL